MTVLDPSISTEIQNDSGVAIPPRSVVQVVSVEYIAATQDNEGKTITHVSKFAGGNAPVLVTGNITIRAGKRGLAYSDQLLYVSMDTAAAVPAAGDQWGPVPGSWVIGSTGSGFISFGWSANNGNPKRGIFYRISPASPPRVLFVITAMGYGYSSPATATITDVTCGGYPPGLNYDGSITVNDPQGCYFNESFPTDGYIGRKGQADYMAPWGYGYGYGSGCRWVCTGLCCPPI